jgi:hypothetical protein
VAPKVTAAWPPVVRTVAMVVPFENTPPLAANSTDVPSGAAEPLMVTVAVTSTTVLT